MCSPAPGTEKVREIRTADKGHGRRNHGEAAAEKDMKGENRAERTAWTRKTYGGKAMETR